MWYIEKENNRYVIHQPHKVRITYKRYPTTCKPLCYKVRYRIILPMTTFLYNV
jgi:hypothetical protein